jgi:RimJ/RimL family protein N-acetyltransferase
VGIHVRGRLTAIRPAGAADVDRLVAWHADPEVSRYWDGETFTREEMQERLARSDVEAWIVEEGDEPVGYLQVHPEGLDMFLIPEARGPGFVEVSRHEAGGEHTAAWILMEFRD